jgi:hypothetical protein
MSFYNPALGQYPHSASFSFPPKVENGTPAAPVAGAYSALASGTMDASAFERFSGTSFFDSPFNNALAAESPGIRTVQGVENPYSAQAGGSSGALDGMLQTLQQLGATLTDYLLQTGTLDAGTAQSFLSRFSAIPAQQQGFWGNSFNYAPVNQTFNGFSPVPFLGSAAQSYGMPTGNNLNLGNYSGLGGTYAPAGAFQDSFMQPGQMPDSAQFSGNNAESATGGSTNAKTKNSEKTGKKNIAKSNHTGTRQTNPKIHSSRSHAGQPVR